MGTTSTPNYDLIKPNIFEELDSWGGHVNANSDVIDTEMKNNADSAGAAQAAADAAQAAADAAQATADGKAPLIHTHVVADITDWPASFPPSAHTHAIGDVTNLQATLDAKAPLVSPNFSGTPALGGAPLATQAYVQGEVHKINRWVDDANYTLTLDDMGRTVRMHTATADRTLTIPPNASVPFPNGTRINVGVWGSFRATIAPGAGVVIRSKENKVMIAEVAFAGITMEKVGENEWWLVGDLS